MVKTHTAGWLHLTDLHVGQPAELGRLAQIEEVFLRDLAEVIRSNNLPIQLVFFSGDVAFRGSASEYVRVSAVMGRILAHIEGINGSLKCATPTPFLLSVPGNHDLARPDAEDARSIHAAFANRAPNSPALWAPDQETAQRAINRSFEGYESWLSHPLPFPPNWIAGKLPGDRAATVTREGITVGFLGLNTAFLHLGDDKPGQLHLDVSQLGIIGDIRRWRELHDFTVLVTHHPPSWLSKVARETLDTEVRRYFDLHLFGHEHAGGHETAPGTEGVRHLFQGRSLFGAEETQNHQRRHGYSVGRFEMEATETRRRRVALWTRPAWEQQGWHFGPGNEKLGKWRLLIDLDDSCGPTTTKTSPSPKWERRLGDLSETAKSAWHRATSYEDVSALFADLADRKWLFLSASIPRKPDHRERCARERAYVENGRPEQIRAFVRLLARRAEEGGLGLVFGGHPSITQSIAPDVIRSTPLSPWLVLFQSEDFWSRLVDDVGAIAYSPAVRPVLVLGNTERLRELMISAPIIGSVFVGGLSGILDEFELVGERHPTLPRIAVPVGGGAAASLFLNEDIAPLAGGATASSRGIMNISRLWHSPITAVEAVLEVLNTKIDRHA